jgi:endo-1,4-beta-xylanase
MGLSLSLGLHLGAASLNAGWPLPYGYGFMVDQDGNFLVDTAGSRLIGSDPPMPALIRDAAAARGLKFGVATKPEFLDATPALWTLIQEQATLLVPETAFQPANIQNVEGVFTFTKADAFIAYANAAGLPYRMPAGMIYPAHDMAWVSTNDGSGVITPTLDGEGNPRLHAGNWQSTIDAHLEAIKGHGIEPTTINVSNELIDPLQTDGWRRHPWYTATNGPGWLIYAFNKARELWPNTPLGLCQDITEQAPDSYYTGIRSWFLTNLQVLLDAGAPIDFVDLQGHLSFARGYNPLSHRTFLEAVRAKGLQIIVGEMDIRTGNSGYHVPGNYPDGTYDAKAAYMISQYLDTILPFVNGGEFVVWGLSDLYNAWGASERPLIYDTALDVKPAYYGAVLERFNFR